MCSNSSKLNDLLHFYIFLIVLHISTKSIIKQLQRPWKSFFHDITVNTLIKDHGLIQIKWLEKVKHVESAKCYIHGCSVRSVP